MSEDKGSTDDSSLESNKNWHYSFADSNSFADANAYISEKSFLNSLNSELMFRTKKSTLFSPWQVKNFEAMLNWLEQSKSPVAELLAAEEESSNSIRKVIKTFGEPKATLNVLREDLKNKVDSVEIANSRWKSYRLEISSPEKRRWLIDAPDEIIETSWEEWLEQYSKLQERIASQLRDQRQELLNFYDVFKKSKQITELDQIAQSFDQLICHSNRLHRRLCQIEKLTSGSRVSEDWILELVAELRRDQARVDECIEYIGDIPLFLLDGSTSYLLITWRRLRIFGKELRRIDDDLNILLLDLLS